MHFPQIIRPQQSSRRSSAMGFSVFSSYCGAIAARRVAQVQHASSLILPGPKRKPVQVDKTGQGKQRNRSPDNIKLKSDPGESQYKVDDASAHGSREKIVEGANSLKPSFSHTLLDSANCPAPELEPPTQATYSSTIEVRYQ